MPRTSIQEGNFADTEPSPLHILLMGDLAEGTMNRLRSQYHIVQSREPGVPPDSVLPIVDLIIVRSPNVVSALLIENAPRLRWIIRAGVGTDNIDMAAASRRGIRVFTTPLSAIAVAELAFGLLLAVIRQIVCLDQYLRQGEWGKNQARGTELAHKNLLIVGFGRIGQKIARIATGYDMRIHICDRSPEKPEKQSILRGIPGASAGPLDEMLPLAEIVALCCPLNRETYHLMDNRRFKLLRPDSVLVNVGRGGLIDESALDAALQEGRLAGAGLDSFETEPCLTSPLFQYPQIVVTPHIGAQTRETRERIGLEVERVIAEDILQDHIQENRRSTQETR